MQKPLSRTATQPRSSGVFGGPAPGERGAKMRGFGVDVASDSGQPGATAQSPCAGENARGSSTERTAARAAVADLERGPQGLRPAASLERGEWGASSRAGRSPTRKLRDLPCRAGAETETVPPSIYHICSSRGFLSLSRIRSEEIFVNETRYIGADKYVFRHIGEDKHVVRRGDWLLFESLPV